MDSKRQQQFEDRLEGMLYTFYDQYTKGELPEELQAIQRESMIELTMLYQAIQVKKVSSHLDEVHEALKILIYILEHGDAEIGISAGLRPVEVVIQQEEEE